MVVETGSVTAASQLLHVTQPAVTKLIKALEDDIGIILFRRVNKRLIPTMEAHHLNAEIDRLLIHVSRIGQLANEMRSIGFGQLKIAALPALGLHFLPEFLPTFRAKYPAVKIDLTVAASQKVVEMILTGKANIGIVNNAINLESTIATALAPLKAVIVLPRGHPLARKSVLDLRDLEAQPFISLGMEDRSRYWVDELFNAHKVNRTLDIETNMTATACQFVSQGLGLSMVDPVTASYFKDSVEIRSVKPAFDFEFSIIQPIGHAASAYASDFIRLLSEHMEALVK